MNRRTFLATILGALEVPFARRWAKAETITVRVVPGGVGLVDPVSPEHTAAFADSNDVWRLPWGAMTPATDGLRFEEAMREINRELDRRGM